MDTFYRLVDFIYSHISSFVNNLVVFMTTDIGESIATGIASSPFWQDILNTLIDVTDILGIYNMTPLEIVFGIGLPAVLIWTLIKWILPTS